MHSQCRCRCSPAEYHLSTFYLACSFCSLSTSVCICLCLHLCITVIYFSISLEVTGSVFLFVVFSFNFSFDSCFLLKPLNFPYCSLYLGFIFQLSLLFQLGEDTLFYTVLYQTSSVTTANSKTSCISNCSLVKEDKSPPSTSFLEVL